MSSKKQRSKEMTTKTNNETPEALSHIKRAHGIYFTSKVLLGWIIKLYFNFRSKVYKPKNKSFILISNHTTMFDPFFEALSFKPYLRFVTSDHLLRMGAWGKFIKFCVNPIPKRRGADSEKTMEMMAESVRNGVSVCIHAEGYCSINGETGFVSPRTGQLVKDSGAGLITFRTVGGYFKDPRWAKHSRRGRMRGSVVREYMPEELQRMSVDEINEAIRRDIYINAYEQQKKDPHKYKGRALAEDLETILYLCPKCHAMGKTHSHDNEFSCECGYKMHINEYGFFEGDSLVFDNVLDWDKWQKSYVKDNLALWHSFTEKPITSDEKQILNCIEENETKELFSDNCTMSIYDDRLEFIDENNGKKVFMLSDIVKMSMGGETKLYFTTSNGFYYEVGSHTRRSSVKYFALYRVLTGREYL